MGQVCMTDTRPIEETATDKANSVLGKMERAMSTREGRKEMKALFEKLEVQADGKASCAGNAQVLRFFFDGAPLDEIQSAFKRISADKQDVLDWESFEDAAASYSTAMQTAESMSTAEGSERFKALFEKIDKDGDGRVSHQEWAKAMTEHEVMQDLEFGNINANVIGKALKRIDADERGSLTWEEFEAHVGSYLATSRLMEAVWHEDGRQELQKLFEGMDRDSDGRITSKEWGQAIGQRQELLRRFFEGVSLKDLGQAFKRIDADSNGYLSWEEFETAAKKGC
eukprot:TRINITY_DN17859_c0_g1_i2.p1 TRINITY_DN17859_c0_g1~~TRINITY_DN17859_c0_g1_i2.p1  ORF type:complete len:283 (+),score=75.70 TRINITY_DN17859_c0_g1_i2:50-898(+)